MRLDKFLSNLGYGSRTELKKLIKKQAVKVNSMVVLKNDLDIDPIKDKVMVYDEEVFYADNLTIMLNKPQNYLSSNEDEAYPSLLKLLPLKYQRLNLKICGRLDYDTEGLVILTTDGNLVHQIISPKNEVSKTYYVKTLKKLSNVKRLEAPLKLMDGKNDFYLTKNAKVEVIDDYSLYLTITEGKFHQVKRMLEAINNEVTYLKRVKIGNLTLNDLELGEFKVLSEEEINLVFRS